MCMHGFEHYEYEYLIVGACVDFYAMNIFLPPIKCYPIATPLIGDKIEMVCGADLRVNLCITLLLQ